MGDIRDCERGTCSCSNGRKARIQFFSECATKGCFDKGMGFVSSVRGEACRSCGNPTEAKHSAVVSD